jgi:hypothetical protein
MNFDRQLSVFQAAKELVVQDCQILSRTRSTDCIYRATHLSCHYNTHLFASKIKVTELSCNTASLPQRIINQRVKSEDFETCTPKFRRLLLPWLEGMGTGYQIPGIHG